MAKRVRNSKKVIETPEETPEVLELEEKTEEIEETPEETPEEIEETPEETPEEIEEIPKQNDIKTVLNHKRKISEKQREHLQKSREIMIQKEKQKKVLMKKFNELQKMNVNIDELIEQAKKLQVKRQYEELYGKSNNETILEKPTKVKYESSSDEEPIRQEKRQLTKQDLLRNKLRGMF